MDARDERLDFGFVADVVALQVAVHETDFDAVRVEEGGGEGDFGEDELEVLDALAVFFELHGAAVV